MALYKLLRLLCNLAPRITSGILVNCYNRP